MRQSHRVSRLGILIGICIIVATLFMTPREAGASASTCNGSCIHVNGKGLHVNYVRGGLTLPHNPSGLYGHAEIWGPGFHFNTPNQRVRNTGREPMLYYAVPALHLNRNFSHGQKICSRWWTLLHGKYYSRPVVCVKILR